MPCFWSVQVAVGIANCALLIGLRVLPNIVRYHQVFRWYMSVEIIMQIVLSSFIGFTNYLLA